MVNHWTVLDYSNYKFLSTGMVGIPGFVLALSVKIDPREKCVAHHVSRDMQYASLSSQEKPND